MTQNTHIVSRCAMFTDRCASLGAVRQEWHFGVREDWRYAEMRQDARLKNHWWWMSFFAGFVVQHAMLYLASMPLLFLYMQKNQPVSVARHLGCEVIQLTFSTIHGPQDLNAFDLLASAVTLIGKVVSCQPPRTCALRTRLHPASPPASVR